MTAATDIITTVDGEIVEQRAPMTLFGTDQPEAVVERASAVATALGGVINERHLFASIGGKKHVQVEGWTLLGSMLGVFAEVEWSRPLDNGWEARAVARTLAGNVVGAAEAMCTVNEGRWKNADTYAVRSMAQTRAVSKALRMPLGFIMHLAGYSATPAEEVPDDQPERGSARQEGSRTRASAPASSDLDQVEELIVEVARAKRAGQYRRDELAALMAEKSLDLKAVEIYATLVGIPKGQRATNDQMDALIDAVRGHGIDEAIEPAVARTADEATTVAGDPAGPAELPPSAGPPPKNRTVEEAIEDAKKKAGATA